MSYFTASCFVVVGPDGSVKLDENRYWSASSVKLAGQTVEVVQDRTTASKISLYSIGLDDVAGRPVDAFLLADMGFADLRGAKAIRRRARDCEARKKFASKRRSLIVRRRAEYLVELIDHSIDPRRFSVFALLRMKAHQQGQFLLKFFLKIFVRVPDNHTHSHVEGAENFDARLKLAERIFELSDFRIACHEVGLSCSGEAKDGGADDESHRLCEGVKKTSSADHAGGSK